MDPDAPFVIAILAIIAGTLITMTKIIINRRSAGAATPKELQAIEERLARMEHAIDSIAIETERISEGQRFTTKVLADRAAAHDQMPAGTRRGSAG
jgi:hypothetical protein